MPYVDLLWRFQGIRIGLAFGAFVRDLLYQQSVQYRNEHKHPSKEAIRRRSTFFAIELRMLGLLHQVKPRLSVTAIILALNRAAEDTICKRDFKGVSATAQIRFQTFNEN
jgi:hypothetical protein